MIRNNVRLRYLQFREELSMKENEIQCLLQTGDLSREQLVITHVPTAKSIGPELLEGVHGCLVGAGNYSMDKDYPWLESVSTLLGHAKQKQFPVFGFCLGGQILARVFGGSVVRDIENQELGICDVNITAAAKNDRLFHDLPDPFATFQGHNIRIETLPPDAILLAKTNVAIQAFTWPESNIYGTQLHPELRKNEFIERIKFYRDDYLHDEDGQAQFESLTNIDAETPEANSLVEKFVDRIVIPYWDKKETI